MAERGARSGGPRPRVVVAGMGDTGVLVATHLVRRAGVVGIATRPALVSGQELGNRLADPEGWRANFLIPFSRFRRMDRVRTVHGRLTGVDLDGKTVDVERADGTMTTEPYDVLVIATGCTNGFWRHARVQDLGEVEADMVATAAQLDAARTIAIVGGGPTGVSVAANLAGAHPDKDVHLFHSGDEPLPGYHPKTRSRIVQELQRAGVHVHPGHRAAVPEGFTGAELTTGPVEWTTGQEPVHADVTLWALGHVTPNTGGLPAELLDELGFVRVDEYLRVPGRPNLFAVGDVAATDPNRSSARNRGYLLVAHNVKAHLAGRDGRLRRYKAPRYRWGSVLGTRDDGMLVFQPNGSAFRVPRWAVQPLLFRLYLHLGLYGGLRRSDPRG